MYNPLIPSTGGVFLLVGYSSTDESLLRPHTNLGVQDAVRALQHYMVQHINNQVSAILQGAAASNETWHVADC